jgi:hypothetical protein
MFYYHFHLSGHFDFDGHAYALVRSHCVMPWGWYLHCIAPPKSSILDEKELLLSAS